MLRYHRHVCWGCVGGDSDTRTRRLAVRLCARERSLLPPRPPRSMANLLQRQDVVCSRSAGAQHGAPPRRGAACRLKQRELVLHLPWLDMRLRSDGLPELLATFPSSFHRRCARDRLRDGFQRLPGKASGEFRSVGRAAPRADWRSPSPPRRHALLVPEVLTRSCLAASEDG